MANLLVPNPCVLCVWADAVTHQLCLDCMDLLKQQNDQIMQVQEFADGLPLDMVTGQPLPVFASSFYTTEMSRVLLNYKDHQRINVAGFLRPIAFRTLQYVADYFGYPYYRLIPMPSSGASMRKRGYNPVSTMLPKPAPPTLVYDVKTLKTRWQLLARASHWGSGVQSRRDGSRHKFSIATRHKPPAEPVILVDDVVTTGATIAAATRTLEAAGFDVVAAVVVAAVMPRS
ncbi:hypothetical protein GCM10027092_10070 [Yaniella soli]